MLHLAIICIACAVAALNGSIAFIDRKNNEFNTFCLSEEGKQNIGRISSPRAYNVDTHKFSDCGTKKITKRISSSLHDYIIKQYRNNRNNSCSIMENDSIKNLKNLNLDFKKKNIKSEKEKCQYRSDKEKILNIIRKSNKYKIRETKYEPDKHHSSVLSHRKKIKKNFKRHSNCFSHKMDDEDLKHRMVKICRKTQIENEQWRKNITYKKNLHEFGQRVLRDSNNSVLVYNNNNNNINLDNKFRLGKNNFKSKHHNIDRNSAFSVNFVRRKKRGAGNTGHVSFYNIPKTISTIMQNEKLRKNPRNFCSENRDIKPTYIKNHFVKPYPYSTKFKSKTNFLYFNEKFFPSQKRKRHYTRKSALHSSQPNFENWPFGKKFSQHQSKIYNMRKRRYDDPTSTKIGSISKFPYLKISRNLGKSVRSSPANSVEVGKFWKREHHINPSLLNRYGKVEVFTEASNIFSPTQKYEEDVLPDHTIERPFLQKDFPNQIDLPDYYDYNSMTDFPQLSPSYHSIQSPSDKLIPFHHYVKIRHALRECLRRKVFKNRIKRAAEMLTSSRKSWRSAPLLCIPYIKKGQEDILRYLIKIMEKMIGKPVSNTGNIFERTKFKPARNLYETGCRDIYEDNYEEIFMGTKPPVGKVSVQRLRIEPSAGKLKESKIKQNFEKINEEAGEVNKDIESVSRSHIRPINAKKITPFKKLITKSSKVKSEPFVEITDKPCYESTSDSSNESSNDSLNESSSISSDKSNDTSKEGQKSSNDLSKSPTESSNSSNESTEKSSTECEPCDEANSETTNSTRSTTATATTPSEVPTTTTRCEEAITTCSAPTISPCDVQTTTPCNVQTTKPCNVQTTTPHSEQTTTPHSVQTTTPHSEQTTTPCTEPACKPYIVQTTTPHTVQTCKPHCVQTSTTNSESTIQPSIVSTPDPFSISTIEPSGELAPLSCSQTNYNASQISFSQIKPEDKKNCSSSPSLFSSSMTPSSVFSTAADFPTTKCDSSQFSLIITTPLSDEFKNDPLIIPDTTATTTQSLIFLTNQPLIYTPSVETTPLPLGSYYPDALDSSPNQNYFSEYLNSDYDESSTVFYTTPTMPPSPEITEPAFDETNTPKMPSLYTLNPLIEQKNYFTFKPLSFTEPPEYSKVQPCQDCELSTTNPLNQDDEIQNLYDKNSKLVGYQKLNGNSKKISPDYEDSLQWPLTSSTSPVSILNEIFQYPYKKLNKKRKYLNDEISKYLRSKYSSDYTDDIPIVKRVSEKGSSSSYIHTKQKAGQNKISKASLNEKDTKRSHCVKSHDNYSKASGHNKTRLKKYSKKLQKYLTRKNRARKMKHSKNYDSLARRKREDDYIWSDIYSDYLDEPVFNDENVRDHIDNNPPTFVKKVNHKCTPPFYDMFNELAKAVSAVSAKSEPEKGKEAHTTICSKDAHGSQTTKRPKVSSGTLTAERVKDASSSQPYERYKPFFITQTVERPKVSSGSQTAESDEVASGPRTKDFGVNLASERGKVVAGNTSVCKAESKKGLIDKKATAFNTTAKNTFNTNGAVDDHTNIFNGTQVKTTAGLTPLLQNFTISLSDCIDRFVITTPNPTNADDKATINIIVPGSIASKATGQEIVRANTANMTVFDVVPANIAHETSAQFIDTDSSDAKKESSLIVPYNTNDKMITSTVATANVTDQMTVTATDFPNTADETNIANNSTSNVIASVNIAAKITQPTTVSVNDVDNITAPVTALANIAEAETEQIVSPTNAADNTTATIITSIKIINKKIANNITPANDTNKEKEEIDFSADESTEQIDAWDDSADKSLEQIYASDNSADQKADQTDVSDKETEQIDASDKSVDKDTEQIDASDSNADKDTEQIDASDINTDKETEQSDDLDNSVYEETEQFDAPDNSSDKASEQVDVSDDSSDKEKELVDASGIADKEKKPIVTPVKSADSGKETIAISAKVKEPIAIPAKSAHKAKESNVTPVADKAIVSNTPAINTSEKTVATTISPADNNAEVTKPNNVDNVCKVTPIDSCSEPVTSNAETEIAKPKNLSKTMQKINSQKDKIHEKNEKLSRIAHENITKTITVKKNDNHSLKPGAQHDQSSKKLAKLKRIKGNLKLKKKIFSTSSKMDLSELESPTEKNLRKSTIKDKCVTDSEDFDIGDGQVPTTLKTAVLIKGPKKIISKLTPKVYSRVYPDSYDYDNVNQTKGTTPKMTFKFFLENKSPLLSSSLKHDIRLQLLAVCEGYLETIRKIKALNKSCGENMDADLAKYCENVISQSFSNQIEKPRYLESSLKSTLNAVEEIENNAKLMSKVNLSVLEKAFENVTDFIELPVGDKIVKGMPLLAVENQNDNCDIKVKIKNFKKGFNTTDLKTKNLLRKNNKYLRLKRLKNFNKHVADKKIKLKSDRMKENKKKEISKDQLKLLKLLKKRKRMLMSRLVTSKDQYKSDDYPKFEYLDYEDFIPTNSEFSEYSGTIKTNKNDKDIKGATESLYSNLCKNTLFPIYAKHYGYDKSGELREIEVLWRSINEKTHEEKILKNMSVVAFLVSSAINPYDESKAAGVKTYHGEETGDIELKNGRKIGLAKEMSDPHDKSTTIETDASLFASECMKKAIATTITTPKQKSIKKSKTTYIRKPDLSSIVGALPYGNKSRDISRKVTQKLGIAKDIFQEYSIEFLNYAVYILPAMFTILFFICCFGCALYILKSSKSFRYRKKKKRRAISSDTSDTSDSEESRSKRKREAKRKKRAQKDSKNEASEKTVRKKFWNVLKMPSASSKDVCEDSNQSERKNFLKCLRKKADKYTKNYSNEVNFADDVKEANSETLERKELISLLEELKKIEVEKAGDIKEVRSAYVQYGGDKDENPIPKCPEFSYPYEKNVFGLPKGYFFFNKKFPNQRTNTPIMRDFELYGNVSETTDLLPCERVFHSINNDCFRHCDFRLKQEGEANPNCKVYRNTGVNKRPFEDTDFMQNESKNLNIIFDKYKNVNLDPSEECLGITNKSKGPEIKITQSAPSSKLLCHKSTDLSEEMENMKHHKKKYVRLKDDGVLCKL